MTSPCNLGRNNMNPIDELHSNFKGRKYNLAYKVKICIPERKL